MLLWLEVRLMMTSAKKVVEGPADEPRDYTRAVTRLMMDQMVEHQEPQ